MLQGNFRLVRPLAAVLVLTLSGLATAQPTAAQPAPSRIANIWDWRAHQPTRGSVRAKERAAGVALSSQQRAGVEDELWRLDHDLLRAEQRSQLGAKARRLNQQLLRGQPEPGER